METDKFSTLLFFIKKKFKLFTIIALLSVVVSSIISSPYFITPKFKSQAIVYPSNLITYSDENETEQLLQLLQSNEVRDSIIEKFDLINHYEIDTTTDGLNFKLYREFNRNVSITKTKYESVDIAVLDKNPKQAKEMVEEIIKQLNHKIQTLHQEKAKEVVVIWENQLENKDELIDTLEKIIQQKSTTYGLLDYSQQSREVTAGYMEMLLTNKKGSSSEEIRSLYKNLQKEGSHFQDLQTQLILAREEHNRLLINYENAKKDVDKKLTYTNMVVSPEVADKKAYPIRWLIVVISFISSMLFALIVVLFYDYLKSN